MKNADAAVLLEAICSVERKRRRFYTVEEQEFLNMVKTPITFGYDIGVETSKKLQALYRKSHGG